MSRIRSWIASHRITPVGWVLLVIMLAGFITAGVGPSSSQTPAFILGVVIALGLLAGSFSGGVLGISTKDFEERRAEFGPKRRDPDEGDYAASDEAMWQHEREGRA